MGRGGSEAPSAPRFPVKIARGMGGLPAGGIKKGGGRGYASRPPGGKRKSMARFCPLCSGSSGNSAYVGSAEGGVLVDAGASCKAILTALAQREIPLKAIGGILITHEPVDHIKGLKVLLKKLPIPVFGPEKSMEYLAQNDLVPPGADLNPLPSLGFDLGELYIEHFETSHDSLGSAGYRIYTPDERKIGIATDLGYVSQEVHAGISGCDLVLLESNYDEGMLITSPYPYSLKRRIKGNMGHLSNDFCACEAKELVKTGTTRVVLGHLSKENNLPQLAYETIRGTLEEAGCRLGEDYLLSVAPRCDHGEMMIL